MPVIRCVCGSEILVVPDLKAMYLAIKNHVVEHKKNFDTSERLTEFLTEQVIIVANKMIPLNQENNSSKQNGCCLNL